MACPQAFLVEILSHPVIVDLAHVGQFDPEKRLCVVGFAVPGACRTARLALECDVFVGVHYVERPPVVDACTHEPVVGYRRLALSGLFGRNQDNAVGAAGAVDGRRGRVFQHVDRLDVPGVDRGQRFVVGNAVENDQRVVAGIARAGAAYADRTPVHSDPGDAGQCRGDVVGGDTLDTVCRDRADGTCDVLAFHRRIAGHDDILQSDHVLRQDYVHRSAPGSYLDGLRQHTEERYFQQVTVFHPFECIVSRVVGQRAAGRSFYYDRSACNGCPVRVLDDTGYRTPNSPPLVSWGLMVTVTELSAVAFAAAGNIRADSTRTKPPLIMPDSLCRGRRPAWMIG